MKLQAFNCPNCKAPLNLPTGSQDRRFIFCQYCGTKIAIDDIEFYKEDSKTQRSQIRADRDVRKNQIDRAAELELEKLKMAAEERDKKRALWIAGFCMIFVIFACILMIYVGVNFG